MVSVFDVAKYILKQCDNVTAMKLQKLCYYAQAWSLVWDESCLFDEKIEAWINGPVVKELYDLHKGRYQLSIDDFTQGNPDILNDNQTETIDRVIEYYAKYNSQQLSDLTHQEAPWKKARRGLNPNDRGSREILQSVMHEYYSSL